MLYRKSPCVSPGRSGWLALESGRKVGAGHRHYYIPGRVQGQQLGLEDAAVYELSVDVALSLNVDFSGVSIVLHFGSSSLSIWWLYLVCCFCFIFVVVQVAFCSKLSQSQPFTLWRTTQLGQDRGSPMCSGSSCRASISLHQSALADHVYLSRGQRVTELRRPISRCHQAQETR